MKPKRRHDKSTETRYYGQSRRLRLLVYADNTARVYYRRPMMRNLFTSVGFAWTFIGEFPLPHAEHIAKTFQDAVDSQARACTVMQVEAPCRAN